MTRQTDTMRAMPFEFKRLLSVLAPLLGALAAAGCSPSIDTHGNYPAAQLVEDVQAGRVNRDDVRRLFGTPSAVGTFEQNTWYYVGAKTRTIAFFDPEVLERQILIVSFDDQGRVSSFEQRNGDDGQTVTLVDRETPTKGRELTILEQLIGNIGRFSSGPEPK